MVGKPDFPQDVETPGASRGSAVGTPGLTAFDEEREASLADEGGASGATIESQDLETLRRLAEELPVAHLQPVKPESDDPAQGFDLGLAAVVAVAGFAVAALGVIAFRRWR